MKYSIVLPVRNGGNYVKECVSSVLSQTYTDFDLLILENASTDDTVGWLSSQTDNRIKVFPSKELLNIEENWGRIVAVQKNEFMTIIGHDDVLDSNYLETMDGLIRQYPGAGLYQSHFRYIDANGAEVRKCRPMAEVQKPSEVVHNFITGEMDIMGTGFMMRSADYDAIGGIPAYPNLLFADMELFIELSRKGFLAVSSAECFSYRKHPTATTSVSTDFKVYKAFDQFVNYLERLAAEDPFLAEVVRSDAGFLLKQYCQGITHKILRTPKNDRKTPSVGKVIDEFRDYGKRLRTTKKFEPLDSFPIRLGSVIDSNRITRDTFLFLKKLIRRPMLRN